MFEFDWSLIQNIKFKDEQEKEDVKNVFKENYWMIREIYRYQASLGTSAGSSPFAIPLNQYYEFVKQTGLLNNKGITVSEIDTIFLVLNKRYKKTDLNPGNALIRFQFLEALIKLGIRKANSKTPIKNIIKDFIEGSVITTHKLGKAQEFRETKYWNEYVDNVYKAHEKLFQEVYFKYSGSKTLPGQAKFMDPSEFEWMFNDSGIQNSKISNREINI